MSATTTNRWPSLQAIAVPHTVDVRGQLLGGLLIRSTTGGRDLGYIWQAGQSWRWRTVSGENFGERSTQLAAVTVLRQIADVGTTTSRPPVLWDAPADAVPVAPRPVPPVSRPTPRTTAPKAEPRRAIVWNDQPADITAAMAAALGKLRNR